MPSTTTPTNQPLSEAQSVELYLQQNYCCQQIILETPLRVGCASSRLK